MPKYYNQWGVFELTDEELKEQLAEDDELYGDDFKFLYEVIKNNEIKKGNQDET